MIVQLSPKHAEAGRKGNTHRQHSVPLVTSDPHAKGGIQENFHHRDLHVNQHLKTFLMRLVGILIDMYF